MEGIRRSNDGGDNKRLSSRGQRVLEALRQAWNRKRPVFRPQYTQHNNTENHSNRMQHTTPRIPHQFDRPSSIRQPSDVFTTDHRNRSIDGQHKYPHDRVVEEELADRQNVTSRHQEVPTFSFRTPQVPEIRKGKYDRQRKQETTSKYPLKQHLMIPATQQSLDIFESSYRNEQATTSKYPLHKVKEIKQHSMLPTTQESLDIFETSYRNEQATTSKCPLQKVRKTTENLMFTTTQESLDIFESSGRNEQATTSECPLQKVRETKETLMLPTTQEPLAILESSYRNEQVTTSEYPLQKVRETNEIVMLPTTQESLDIFESSYSNEQATTSKYPLQKMREIKENLMIPTTQESLDIFETSYRNEQDVTTSKYPLQKVMEIKQHSMVPTAQVDIFETSYHRDCYYDQDVMSREKVSKYLRDNFNVQASFDLFDDDEDDYDESPMDLSPPQSVPVNRTTMNSARTAQHVPMSKNTNCKPEASVLISKDVQNLNQGTRMNTVLRNRDVTNGDLTNISFDFSHGITKLCQAQKDTSDEFLCHGRMNEDPSEIRSHFNKISKVIKVSGSAPALNSEANHRPTTFVGREMNNEINDGRECFMLDEGDRESLQSAENMILNFDQNVVDQTDESIHQETNLSNIIGHEEDEIGVSPHLETCKYASNQVDGSDPLVKPENGGYFNSIVPSFDLGISSIDDLFDDSQDSLLTAFITGKDQGHISEGDVNKAKNTARFETDSREDLFACGKAWETSKDSLSDYIKDVDQAHISAKDVCATLDLQAISFSSEDLFSSGENINKSEGSSALFKNVTDRAHGNGKNVRKTNLAKTFYSENLFFNDDTEMQISDNLLSLDLFKATDQDEETGNDASETHDDLPASSSEDLFASDTVCKHSEGSIMAQKSGVETHALKDPECVISEIEHEEPGIRRINEKVFTDLKISSIQCSEMEENQVGEVTPLAEIIIAGKEQANRSGKNISINEAKTNSTERRDYLFSRVTESSKSTDMSLKKVCKNTPLNPSKSSQSPQVLNHNQFKLPDEKVIPLNAQGSSKILPSPNKSSEIPHNLVSKKYINQDLSFKNTHKTKEDNIIKKILNLKSTSNDLTLSGNHASKKQPRKRPVPTGTKPSGKVTTGKKQKGNDTQVTKSASRQTKIPFKITKLPSVEENPKNSQFKTAKVTGLKQRKNAFEVATSTSSKCDNTAKPQGAMSNKENQVGKKVMKDSVPLKAKVSGKSPIVERKLIIPDMFQKNTAKTSASNLPPNNTSSAKKSKFKVPYKRQDIEGVEDIDIALGSNGLPVERISVVQLTDQTYPLIEKKLSTCTLKEIVLTIVYREGFSQLNLPEEKSRATDRCTATGVMLAITSIINTTYCRLDSSMERWSNPAIPKSFLSSLLTASCKKVCYDAQAMAMFLVDAFGFDHKEVCAKMDVIDPLVGCWLLDPDHPPSTFLDALVVGGVTQTSRRTEDKNSRVCQSLKLLSELAVNLQQKLEERHLWRLFTGMEMKLVPVLAVMELRGMRVNKKKFHEISGILEKRIVFLQEAAYKAAGRRFQLNSTQQLRQILYEELKLDVKHSIVIKGTVSLGAKSTSEAMLRLMEKLHPLPGIVLEYRHLQKLKSTYVDAMLQHIRGDAIFTTWEQTAAATGRISSSNPNLQAVPKQHVSSSTAEHSKQGPEFGPLSLRAPYVPRDGCSFLTADFQHIELRLFAYLSQDTALLRELQQPGDIFMLLARAWLGRSGHAIGPDDRERTKRIVYSVMYGAGPGKLLDFLDVSGEEANQIINSFVAMFPALRAYPRRLIAQCRRQGYLCSISGRRRMFPNISSPNPGIRTHSERQAINFVIQGSAADICKSAMLHTERQLSTRPELDARLLLQIHDELVWDVPSQHVPEVTEIVREAMMASATLYGVDVKLRIPLPVAVATGSHWGDMK